MRIFGINIIISRKDLATEKISSAIEQTDEWLVSRKTAGLAFERLKRLYFLGYKHGRSKVKGQNVTRLVETAHREIKGTYKIKVEKKKGTNNATTTNP